MASEAFVYVGTNSLRGSKGIYTLRLDCETGAMEIVGTTPAENAAYLCLPRSHTALYAVIESLEYEGKAGGGVAAYELAGGIPRPLNRLYAEGGWPCHISLSHEEKEAYVSVFRNGLWQSYPIAPDGSLSPARVTKRHGEPNGRPSHIHAAIPSPDGKYAVVADCGMDRVYLYDAQNGGLVDEVRFPEDSGPRQLVFSADHRFLYLLTEASCDLFCMKYLPQAQNKLRIIQRISTLRADGYEGKNYGGGLHFHPSGRYLVSTNRGHNSLAVFAVEPATGHLALAGHHMLAGDHCREFAFTEDGRILVAGLQHTDVVQSFYFNQKDGSVRETGYALALPSPSAVVIAQ